MRADETLNETASTHPGDASTWPYLFVVLECDRPLSGCSRHALEGIETVTIGRGPDRAATRQGAALDLRLPSGFLSTQHARLCRLGERWVFEDNQSTNGSWLNGVRTTRELLRDGDVIELGRTFLRFRAGLLPTEGALDVDSRQAAAEPGLLTLLPALAADLGALCRVAPSLVPVLLFGDTGTGKELVARAVHRLSGRRADGFVPVNCGALPDSLVESQLFGHTRGAFTGALRDEEGLVRAAHKGTLFLDEIGDLPPLAQAKLLRVLQECEVTPVGATRPIKVDLRVVAATHRRLDRMVARGEFRSDLYARLSGCERSLPALRERREDLGLLIAAILREVAPDRAERIQLGPEVGRAFLRHDWPHNIRELLQCLRLVTVLAEDGIVKRAHLPEALRGPRRHTPEETPDSQDSSPEEDQERLRTALEALLEKHHGNVSEVSRAMGKARMQIHRWMQRFDIDIKKYRT